MKNTHFTIRMKENDITYTYKRGKYNTPLIDLAKNVIKIEC